MGHHGGRRPCQSQAAQERVDHVTIQASKSRPEADLAPACKVEAAFLDILAPTEPLSYAAIDPESFLRLPKSLNETWNLKPEPQ